MSKRSNFTLKNRGILLKGCGYQADVCWQILNTVKQTSVGNCQILSSRRLLQISITIKPTTLIWGFNRSSFTLKNRGILIKGCDYQADVCWQMSNTIHPSIHPSIHGCQISNTIKQTTLI